MKKIILAIIFFLLFILVSSLQAPSASAQCASCTFIQQYEQCGGDLYTDCNGTSTGSAGPLGSSTTRVVVDQYDCSGTTQWHTQTGGCISAPGSSCSCTSPPGGGSGSVIRFPTDLPLRPPSGASPTTVIGNIVTFIIYVLAAMGIIASVIWLLYGGIKYVTAGGDKAAIEGAKTHIISALLGLIIVLFTFVIISLVLSVFGTGGLSGIRFQLPSIF